MYINNVTRRTRCDKIRIYYIYDYYLNIILIQQK